MENEITNEIMTVAEMEVAPEAVETQVEAVAEVAPVKVKKIKVVEDYRAGNKHSQRTHYISETKELTKHKLFDILRRAAIKTAGAIAKVDRVEIDSHKRKGFFKITAFLLDGTKTSNRTTFTEVEVKVNP